MPSESILKSKQQFVTELVEKIKSSGTGVLVSYKGINVENDTKLRKEMREAGVDYFVVKNTMLRFASKEVGYDFDEKLTGTTALALSPEDPVNVAKILTKYAKELSDDTEFSLKTGFVDGKVVDVDTIVEIGSLPSKEQLVGQLVSVLVAPIRGLAIALNAVAEKDPEELKAEQAAKAEDAKTEEAAPKTEEAKGEKPAEEKAEAKVEEKAEAPAKEEKKAPAKKPAAKKKAVADDAKAEEKPATKAKATKAKSSSASATKTTKAKTTGKTAASKAKDAEATEKAEKETSESKED